MSLLLIAVALPWIIVALGCWLGYQLLRQNGRILVRLEALEQQLAPLLPPEPGPELPVGEAAPDFELENLAGGRTALSEFRGRRVLLVLFNPQCSFCRAMAPRLAAISPEAAEGNPVPLVVTTGDAELNRALVREHGIRCPVLLQKGAEVASQYEAHGTPSGCLIDEQGRIASPIALGADALLALARPPEGDSSDGTGQGGRNGHHVFKGNQPISASRINRSGLKAGTPAPTFRLPRLDGGELSLEDYRGRRVLLVFSDPECKACDQLAPKLERLHRRRRDVQVLVVSRRDAAANRSKVNEFGLTFPVALQRQWEISRLYEMFATPIGYLIDEQGVMAAGVAAGVEPILALASAAAAEFSNTSLRGGKENGTSV